MGIYEVGKRPTGRREPSGVGRIEAYHTVRMEKASRNREPILLDTLAAGNVQVVGRK